MGLTQELIDPVLGELTLRFLCYHFQTPRVFLFEMRIKISCGSFILILMILVLLHILRPRQTALLLVINMVLQVPSVRGTVVRPRVEFLPLNLVLREVSLLVRPDLQSPVRVEITPLEKLTSRLLETAVDSFVELVALTMIIL
jgi:hypothetical protein